MWSEILAVVGGIAALVAALVFLMRVLLTHWLAKDLEYLKSEIGAVAKKSEVRFTALQTRRADVIARLYGAISDAYVHGSVLASAIEMHGVADQEQRAETARAAANRALRLNSRYRIWLPRELPSKVAELAANLAEIPLKCSLYRKGRIDETAVRDAAARWEKQKAATKEALDSLEAEFRKIVDPDEYH